MKKLVMAALFFILIAALTGCAMDNEKNAEDPPELDITNIPEMYLLGMSEEAVHEMLGEPDSTLSGFWGDSWILEDGREITVYYDGNGLVENVVQDNLWDLIPMVMVNDTLYLDTGHINDEIKKCGTMDGKITSQVNGNQIPTINDQSNFGMGYEYQYGAPGTIEVYINDKWQVFATKEAKSELQ